MLIADGQGFAQVHEAAALGIYRQALFRRLPQRAAEDLVFGQKSRLRLRKTAADIECIQSGQRVVAYGADLDNLAPRVGRASIFSG